jgi:hypothetical protein
MELNNFRFETSDKSAGSSNICLLGASAFYVVAVFFCSLGDLSHVPMFQAPRQLLYLIGALGCVGAFGWFLYMLGALGWFNV